MASLRWGLASGADTNVPFAGNSALSGCRYVGAGAADDGVACAWNELAADANTVGLWRFNGDYLDASGNGRNGTAVGGATIVTSGMDREVSLPADGSYVNTAMVVPTGALSVEGWVYPTTVAGKYRPFSNCAATSGGGSPWSWWVGLNSDGKWYGQIDRVGASQGVAGAMAAISTRYHVALVYTGSVMVLYVNGVSQGQASITGSRYNHIYHRMGNYVNSTNNWRGEIDEVRVSNVARYTGAFSPAFYKSAPQNGGVQPYVQASHSSLTGMVPSAVSWSATTGAEYGQVKRVWVNSESGWTQIGGDYPTSPVSVSGLVLPSADAMRFELEPKADALQSETPVLDWVQLDYTAPVSGYGRPRYSRITSGFLTGLVR